MSWVAAAVGVGTAAYGIYNQNKTQNEAKKNAANLFGKKPKTAPFVPTDLTAEEQKSLAGNLSNADQIEALLNRLVPGWSANLAQGTKNALDWQQGNIGAPALAALGRSSAYKNIRSGIHGSQMGDAATSSNLVDAIFQYQQAGANAAQLWANTAEKAYSPWLSSGAEQNANTRANLTGLQAQQQREFNVKAGADPTAYGIYGSNAVSNALNANYVQQAGGAFVNAYQQSQQPQGLYNYSGSRTG